MISTQVVEEEKIDMSEKVEDKPDPYAEDRRKQAAQLKKIQGYLHRAQTIVKEVRIQQVLWSVSWTPLDPTPSTRRPTRRPRRRRKMNGRPAERRGRRWR